VLKVSKEAFCGNRVFALQPKPLNTLPLFGNDLPTNGDVPHSHFVAALCHADDNTGI
jgi:hypothetical protein